MCTGRLIGNPQFASQWERSVNELPSVIALLAADIARESGKDLLSDEDMTDEMASEGITKSENAMNA